MQFRVYVFPKIKQTKDGVECYKKDKEGVKIALSNTIPNGVEKMLIRSIWCYGSLDGFIRVIPHENKEIHLGTKEIDPNCKYEDLFDDSPEVKAAVDYDDYKAWKAAQAKEEPEAEDPLAKARAVKKALKEAKRAELAALEADE